VTDLITWLSTELAELDPFRLLGILLTIFAAAIVKGAIGFGFPLVATPLISTLWDARHAVLIIALANFTNNIGVVARGGGSRPTLRRIAPLLAGVSVGTVGGALLLARVPASVLAVIVGTAAIAFASIALLKPDLAMPPRLERILGLPMGILGGLLGGSTGISGPFVASYLHALQLSKREFIFFLTLLYLVVAVIQVAAYSQLALFDAVSLAVGVASLAPNLLGVWLGFRIQDRIDPKLFRRLVVIVIGLAGTSLVLRGLWQ
jgi:uncharacterized membrane protein YfcA